MQEVLLDLQVHGFRLSLDDFGTGYSSLLHLQKISVDELKIDRYFISQLGIDEKNDTLVGAMRWLCRLGSTLLPRVWKPKISRSSYARWAATCSRGFCSARR